MELLLAILIPTVLISCWLFSAYLTRNSFQQLRNKRICLLIAHPDDEAMFFSPTLLALTEPNLGNHVKILCLSKGNNDGMGALRQKELVVSAGLLGLRAPKEDVFVIDSPSFPDSMSAHWPAGLVSEVLNSAFSPPSASSAQKRPIKRVTDITRTSDGPPGATIDILLTFDEIGVSGHPNHISLYHGARAWLEGLIEGYDGWRCPVELYTLTSTNIVRKYMSILDVPITMLWGIVRGVISNDDNIDGRSIKERDRTTLPTPSKLLFANDLMQYRLSQKAMTQGHKSQMRWFRWGWIGVGRYMVVNDLKREMIK